jgi:hypothetical protein
LAVVVAGMGGPGGVVDVGFALWAVSLEVQGTVEKRCRIVRKIEGRIEERAVGRRERASYFQSARYGPNSVTRFTSASSDFPVVKSGVRGVDFAIVGAK